MHLADGRYGLVQFKLGATDEAIAQGAAKLHNLADQIDTTRMLTPAFMMVLAGNGLYAYRRPDGVYVVPLGCLKP